MKDSARVPRMKKFHVIAAKHGTSLDGEIRYSLILIPVYLHVLIERHFLICKLWVAFR